MRSLAPPWRASADRSSSAVTSLGSRAGRLGAALCSSSRTSSVRIEEGAPAGGQAAPQQRLQLPGVSLILVQKESAGKLGSQARLAAVTVPLREEPLTQLRVVKDNAAEEMACEERYVLAPIVEAGNTHSHREAGEEVVFQLVHRPIGRGDETNVRGPTA